MTLASLIEHHSWAEKYRPATTADCITTVEVGKYVQKALAEKKVHNAVFVGTPGLGKTTTGLALGNDLSLDTLKINSSKDGTMDELRTTMQQFVQTASFTGEDKLMILDEGDNLSVRMMGALRGFIEEYSAGCSFIITVNNPSKLDEAILSRCPPVDFSIPKEEEGTIMLQQFQMIKKIFEAEGIAAKNVDIAQTIKRIFPDLRKAMNLIQRACATGTFDPSSILGSMDGGMDTLYDALASKAYVKILTWVDSNQPVANSKDVYRGIYDMYRSKVDPEVLATAVLTIEEYMDKATRSINPQITLLGCLARLIREAPIA